MRHAKIIIQPRTKIDVSFLCEENASCLTLTRVKCLLNQLILHLLNWHQFDLASVKRMNNFCVSNWWLVPIKYRWKIRSFMFHDVCRALVLRVFCSFSIEKPTNHAISRYFYGKLNLWWKIEVYFFFAMKLSFANDKPIQNLEQWDVRHAGYIAK